MTTVGLAKAAPSLPVADAGGRLLEVSDLTVEFSTRRGDLTVVENVGFGLDAASTVGLVGESGSGKSVTARAILGLTGAHGRIVSGRVELEGRDLTKLSDHELRSVRGREIAMIFQEPRRSLDPAFTVGQQIAEVSRRNLGLSRRAAWKHAVTMLERVHIADAERRANNYPHQFSGGMCQRVMLAMALSSSPKVLIADEPTTALDVTVQAHILELIREMQRDLGLGVIFITHDLGVVAQMCDRVVVMYAGQVVEDALVDVVFRHPQHPYTQALLDSLPQNARERLVRIPGVMPSPGNVPIGCRFHPRCGYTQTPCVAERIALAVVGERHSARCCRHDELTLRGIG